MKPEERFLYDILVQVKPKISDKYPNSIFFILNDKILFEYNQKNGYFWCKYNEIWSVFEDKFNLDYIDIQMLIKKVVLNTLNLRDISPGSWFNFNKKSVKYT